MSFDFSTDPFFPRGLGLDRWGFSAGRRSKGGRRSVGIPSVPSTAFPLRLRALLKRMSGDLKKKIERVFQSRTCASAFLGSGSPLPAGLGVIVFVVFFPCGGLQRVLEACDGSTLWASSLLVASVRTRAVASPGGLASCRHLRSLTSDQVGPPAELKHINKRRKRN